MVAHRFQRAGNLVFSQINIRDHGEAKCNGAGTGGYDHLVDRAKGVDKCGNTVLGVVQQTGQVAAFQAAEDQRRTDRDGDNVDHARHVMAQRYYTKVQPHLYAAFRTLLDHIAHQTRQNALGLVILDDACNGVGIVCLAQHDSYAGNVTGDQGNAQRADDGIGNKADTGFIGIGIRPVHIFQALNDLCADRCGKARVKRLSQILLVCDQTFQDIDAGRQITQSPDFYAGSSVNGREKICRIRESNFFISAVFGNGIIYRALSQAGNCIGSAVDKIS